MPKSNQKKGTDQVQIDNFLKTLENEFPKKDLEKISPILDFNKIMRNTARMFVMHWYFNQDQFNAISYEKEDKKKISYEQEYKNAMDQVDENNVIKRFLTKQVNATIIEEFPTRDTATPSSMRATMNDCVDKDHLFLRDGRNIWLTSLGINCGHFLYFKALENRIGVSKLWDIIKTELKEGNLQNIDPKITTADLIRWYIIEKKNENIQFTDIFKNFIDFLQYHPELYQEESKIILDNLLDWINNTIVQILDEKNVPLTKSAKKIYSFKQNLSDVDWIYRLNAVTGNARNHYDLKKWVEETHESHDNLRILTAPPGYGKSIFLLQFACDLLSCTSPSQDNLRIFVPLFLSMKDFQIKNDTLYYLDTKLWDLAQIDDIKEIPSSNKIIEGLIGAALFQYKTTDFMLKMFRSIIEDHQLVLIFDAWDEAQGSCEQYLNIILKSLSEIDDVNKDGEKQATTRYKRDKFIISTRYITPILKQEIQRLYPEVYDNDSPPAISNNIRKKEDVYIQLELPEKKDAFNYLKLLSKKFAKLEDLEVIEKQLNGILTPFDLFLLGIFPRMDIPKYKSQLYDRWIYYQILPDFVDIAKLNKIKSINDIRVILESTKVRRDNDGLEFSLSQLIDGTIPGVGLMNYSLMNVLSNACYSEANSKFVAQVKYLDAIAYNPIIKRFIRPFYSDLERDSALLPHARIMDYHFFGYFVAKSIFSRFLENEDYIPLVQDEIENFLKEFYLISPDLTSFQDLGIATPEDFVCHLYLQSRAELPALRLSYSHADSIFSIPLESKAMDYGVYLQKAFHREYQKAMEQNDNPRRKYLSLLFQQFIKERPTMTNGFYMDEESYDIDVGEPEINHEPGVYFDIVVKLLDLPEYPKKNAPEIEYLGMKDDYIMSLGSSRLLDKQSFWKNTDYEALLRSIFLHEDRYVLPWFAQVFNSYCKLTSMEKAREIIDFDVTIGYFKEATDDLIKKAVIDLLIIVDPERTLESSDMVLQSLVPNQVMKEEVINKFISILVGEIRDGEPIPENIFASWLSYFHDACTSLKRKFLLIRPLYTAQLDEKQLIILTSLYSDEQNHKNAFGEEDKDSPEYFTEETMQDFLFQFNCLLVMNYKQEMRRSRDPRSHEFRSLLDKSDLMLKHALLREKYFYFAIVKESGYFSDQDINDQFLLLDFPTAFSFSKDTLHYRPSDNEAPHDMMMREFLTLTFNNLLELRQEWWNKRKPRDFDELTRFVKEIFEKYRPSWQTSSFLDDYQISRLYLNPEAIQLSILLQFARDQFPDAYTHFLEFIFDMIDSCYLQTNKQLPAFVAFFFKECQDMRADIRMRWIQKLMEHSVSYIYFKSLFSGLDDISSLYQIILEKYGPEIVRKFSSVPGRRQRGADFTILASNADITIPPKLTFFLPFEMLDAYIRKFLDFDRLKAEYDAQVYDNCKETLINSKEIEEKSSEFLLALYSYTYSLIKLSSNPSYTTASLSKIEAIWSQYCIFPLVSARMHPSMTIRTAIRWYERMILYNTMKMSEAKIILGLDILYTESWKPRVASGILKDLMTSNVEVITATLEKLLDTDWKLDYFAILLLFSQFTPKTCDCIFNFVKDQGNDLSRELAWKQKESERKTGRTDLSIMTVEKRSSPDYLERYFKNPVMVEQNIIARYALLLNLLCFQIPDNIFLKTLFSRHEDENFADIIKELQELPKSDYSMLVNLLDDAKVFEYFIDAKEQYLSQVSRMISNKGLQYREMHDDPPYSDNYETVNILDFFRNNGNNADLTTEPKSSLYPGISRERNQEKLDVLEEIQSGVASFEDLIKYLEIGVTESESYQTYHSIKEMIVPTFYVDNADDYYTGTPPALQRKYQEDFLWFLARKQIENQKVGAEKTNYQKIEDMNNIRHLLFDGIIHDNLCKWYNDKPEDIPLNFVINVLDPIIVHEVYFPNHVDRVPEHLRDMARKYSWRTIIVRDLLKKAQDYFEAYRNVFD